MQSLLNYINDFGLIAMTQTPVHTFTGYDIDNAMDLGLIQYYKNRHTYKLTAEGRKAQSIGFEKWKKEKEGAENFKKRKDQAEYLLTRSQIKDIRNSKIRSWVAIIISAVVFIYEILFG